MCYIRLVDHGMLQCRMLAVHAGLAAGQQAHKRRERLLIHVHPHPGRQLLLHTLVGGGILVGGGGMSSLQLPIAAVPARWAYVDSGMMMA